MILTWDGELRLRKSKTTLDLYHQALRHYALKTKHYKKEVKTVLDTTREIQDSFLAIFEVPVSLTSEYFEMCPPKIV